VLGASPQSLTIPRRDLVSDLTQTLKIDRPPVELRVQKPQVGVAELLSPPHRGPEGSAPLHQARVSPFFTGGVTGGD